MKCNNYLPVSNGLIFHYNQVKSCDVTRGNWPILVFFIFFFYQQLSYIT